MASITRIYPRLARRGDGSSICQCRRAICRRWRRKCFPECESAVCRERNPKQRLPEKEGAAGPENGRDIPPGESASGIGKAGERVAERRPQLPRQEDGEAAARPSKNTPKPAGESEAKMWMIRGAFRGEVQGAMPLEERGWGEKKVGSVSKAGHKGTRKKKAYGSLKKDAPRHSMASKKALASTTTTTTTATTTTTVTTTVGADDNLIPATRPLHTLMSSLSVPSTPLVSRSKRPSIPLESIPTLTIFIPNTNITKTIRGVIVTPSSPVSATARRPADANANSNTPRPGAGSTRGTNSPGLPGITPSGADPASPTTSRQGVLSTSAKVSGVDPTTISMVPGPATMVSPPRGTSTYADMNVNGNAFQSQQPNIGVIVGATLGALTAVALVVGFFLYRYYRRYKHPFQELLLSEKRKGSMSSSSSSASRLASLNFPASLRLPFETIGRDAGTTYNVAPLSAGATAAAAAASSGASGNASNPRGASQPGSMSESPRLPSFTFKPLPLSPLSSPTSPARVVSSDTLSSGDSYGTLSVLSALVDAPSPIYESLTSQKPFSSILQYPPAVSAPKDKPLPPLPFHRRSKSQEFVSSGQNQAAASSSSLAPSNSAPSTNLLSVGDAGQEGRSSFLSSSSGEAIIKLDGDSPDLSPKEGKNKNVVVFPAPPPSSRSSRNFF
ncbi:uncharacterized protein VTP21DRAFT_7750 [Calcarisporiella thermophila]|uniref:uncharacterized protein n=1 Tax=Calcarisporiella thermophila TaxID=911321 RepID=UPI0037447EE6